MIHQGEKRERNHHAADKTELSPPISTNLLGQLRHREERQHRHRETRAQCNPATASGRIVSERAGEQLPDAPQPDRHGGKTQYPPDNPQIIRIQSAETGGQQDRPGKRPQKIRPIRVYGDSSGRDQWGFPDATDFTMRDRFAAKYQGQRFSFGYPACPNLEDQEKLFALLKPEDIGVQLTEGFMMEPEASVSAIVFAHPDARYFNV